MKTKKSLSRIKLFDDIVDYMESNLDKWNSIDVIRRTYDEFTHNLKKIRELKPEFERDLTPVLKELSVKRDLLTDKLFPIVNILEVYAEDHKLGKKVSSLLISGKELESLGNKKLLSHSSRLHRFIYKNMHHPEENQNTGEQISTGQPLQPYGLTEFISDDLNVSINQYDSALRLHRDVLIYRKKARKKMNELIQLNSKLLKNRLNKLMTVFSGTHPSFYQEYNSKVSEK